MCHESVDRFGEQVAQKESFLQVFFIVINFYHNLSYHTYD